MNRTAIQEFMQALAIGPADPSSTAEWVNLRCPLAPWTHARGTDRVASFGIRVDDKAESRCNCFTCHYTESFASLAYKLGQLRKHDYSAIAREIERQEFIGSSYIPAPYRDGVAPIICDEVESDDGEEAELPDQNCRFWYQSAIGHPYLRQRGIDAWTTAGLGLRYDPTQRRILFPVTDVAGRFRGFSGRRIDPAWGTDAEGVPIERDGSIYLKVRDYLGLPKAKVLLGENRIRDWSMGAQSSTLLGGQPSRERSRRRYPIVLVEGLFDYAYLIRLGVPNVLSLLGSHLSRDPTRRITIENFGLPMVMFLDNDKAGRDARDSIVEQLFGRIGLMDVKYPEGYEGADPASLPPSIVHSMLRNTEIVLRKPTI